MVHISGVNNLPGAPPRSSGVQHIREPPQRRKEKHPRDRSGCGPKRVRAAPLLRKAHAAIIGRFVGRSLSSVRPCASLGRRRDAGRTPNPLPLRRPPLRCRNQVGHCAPRGATAMAKTRPSGVIAARNRNSGTPRSCASSTTIGAKACLRARHNAPWRSESPHHKQQY